MQVLTLIAAGHLHGTQSGLSVGDRTALHFGNLLAGGPCEARCPESDRHAWTYAVAAGASCAAWNESGMLSPDVILVGPGAIELWGDELAGRLAERFAAELFFDVLSIDWRDSVWTVVCDAGRGCKDIVQLAGPVVVVVSDQAARAPYVSNFRLTQAERFTPTLATVADISPTWQPVTPRPPRKTSPLAVAAEDRTNAAFGIESASAQDRSQKFFSDTPAVCAQVLLRYLVHHGFVSRRLPENQDRPVAAPTSNRQPITTTSLPQSGLTPSQRRSPRRAAESVQRLTRRPRLATDTSVTGQESAFAGPLQRGPRCLNHSERPGRRGPFRLKSLEA